MVSIRVLRIALGAAVILSAAACGGGGGGSSASNGGGATGGGGTTPPPTNNVASVVIDGGPPQANSVNTLFTTITVCVPGSTTNCQTIDHIQVDTGSYGLRILAPVLTLTLPVETLAANGNVLAECTQFVDGFTWGPITTADIQIAGESAHGVPVQVIGDSRLPNVPANCSSTGGTEEDTVADFGANGILGIGPFELDCGDCDQNMHGLYYACPAGGGACTDTTLPANQQVPNPVTHFAADNNGSIIVLPTVAAAGASEVSGQLIFGIDTQSNNASGTETVLNVDNEGNLLATFNGTTYAMSFIDSGSNGIFFTDTSIPACTAPSNDPTSGIVDFYCPTSTVALTVSLQGTNGSMANSIPFDVGNAITMLNNNPNGDAFPQLAGTLPAGNDASFDYGLPFFYGRRVAIAVEGDKTSMGTGPYIAF
jgi:hypothetical protein